MSQAQDDLVAAASNPNAELTTLHELANNYPGLRPYIAENPRTYPALLEWLGTLGDPAVDAALVRRNAPTQSPAGAAGDSATQVIPPSASGQPATQEPESSYQQRSLAETQRQEPIQPAQPQYEQATQYQPAQPQYEQATQYQPAQPQYEQATQYQPAAQPQYQPAQPQYQQAQYQQAAQTSSPSLLGVGEEAEAEGSPHSFPWLKVLGAIAIVVVVALIAWFVMSDHGDDDRPAGASSSAAAEQTTAEQTQQPSKSPSASTTPSASASPSKTIKAPAPDGATEMDGFTAPSGNITCTLGTDSVTCTINKHDFVPQDGSCNNSSGSPYTASLGAQGAGTGSCGTPFSNSGNTLNYGSSAKNDTFACTSSDSGIECWSQVSGQNFTLSRENATFASH